MNDDDAELRNPFPSPPSHYTNYTTNNLALLRLLKERTASGSPSLSATGPSQHDILHDQTDVPNWPLTQLEKPRVDWILDDPEGYYDVFGDRWFIKEPIPSLAEQGGNQLYPTDPSIDRRPALLSILRSLLVSYSALTASLLAPPPPSTEVRPEWQQHVEWITVMAQNIMAAANDLRPVQARGNLELMMKRQLDLRREETRLLHEKCDTLEAKLSVLRQVTAAKVGDTRTHSVKLERDVDMMENHGIDVQQEDVLRWAEEVLSEIQNLVKVGTRQMATRRRIGVSAATTEAARRQLMQPVPCWEQRWVHTDTGTGTTSFKILKWVKTDKIQQFSDEEGEVDEPLAPLPDEPEVVDGDEEGELDDVVAAGADGGALVLREEESVVGTKDQDLLLSKPPSPKPQLSMSLAEEEGTNGLDNMSLNPFDGTMDEDEIIVGEKLDGEDMMGLDMSGLGPGPHGTDFVGDLDELLGGSIMGQTDDPFAQDVDG